jgi:uncharacterized protein (DUF1330 family)
MPALASRRVREERMKGYLIADIEVRDAATFDRYRQEVAPMIARFGGRYLVRGGEIRELEGHLGFKRLVILEFPSPEAAMRFYDSEEYRPLLELRKASAASSVALVTGYVPPDAG